MTHGTEVCVIRWVEGCRFWVVGEVVVAPNAWVAQEARNLTFFRTQG
jgi:hypothetical protein